MGSRNRWFSWLAMVMVSLALSKADFEKDKQECAEELIGLATCLPYVSGQAKVPTMDCCTRLKQVLQKSELCMCILVKDRNEPSLELNINATLALGLPESCHAPANISDCPRLLNIPPNSAEAKVFEDYVRSTKKSNNVIAPPENASNGQRVPNGGTKSDAGWGKKWLGIEMVLGVLFIIVTFLQTKL